MQERGVAAAAEESDAAAGTCESGSTIGAVLGITAAVWGITQVGEKIEQMIAFAGSALTAEGPPPADIVAEMDRRGAQLKRNGTIDLLLQLGAVIAMSTARYW